jgi:hypothetical protein
MRQDADAAEMLRLFRSMEQRQREEAERREPATSTNVTVEAPTVELPPGFGGTPEPEKKPDEDEGADLKLVMKRATAVILAGLMALTVGMVVKKKKRPAAK